MTIRKKGELKRPVNRMPAWIRQALVDTGLMERYRSRPPYQRNDYLGWIIHPKLEATRERHLEQMLSELKRGDHYMGMPWHGEAARP
ncbi:MAG: YdeI/OmpD-associated family protein [bacterium]